MADKATKKTPAKAPEKSLKEQLADVRKELLDTQKTHRSGELVNPRVIGQYRKQIARIMTKISAEKEGK